MKALNLTLKTRTNTLSNAILAALLVLAANLYFVSAQTAQTTELYIETGHTEKILDYGFDRSGDLLVTLSGVRKDGRGDTAPWNGVAKIWNLKTTAQLRSVEILPRPDTTEFSVPNQLSFRNNFLFVWFGNGSVRVFDVLRNIEIEAKALPSGIVEAADPERFRVSEEKKVRIDIQDSNRFSTSEQLSSCRSTDSVPDLYSANTGRAKSAIKILDRDTGNLLGDLSGTALSADQLVAASERVVITTAGDDNELINLWRLGGSAIALDVISHGDHIYETAATDDLRLVASADKTIRVWEVETGRIHRELIGHTGEVLDLQFSKDGRFLISLANDDRLLVWNLQTGNTILQMDCFPEEYRGSVAIDEGGGTIATAGKSKIAVWDVGSKTKIRETEFDGVGFFYKELRLRFTETGKEIPEIRKVSFYDWPPKELRLGGGLKVKQGSNGELIVAREADDAPIAKLVSPEKGAAVIVDKEGRFDTNKPLDNIEGLHWIVNGEIFNPVPLEAFMRQYYEPGLLARIFKCNTENDSDGTDTCDKEFKSLPSIADLNRVQAKVGEPVVSAVKPDGTVDVTVAVESVTEEVTVSADRTKKAKLTSGAFDLRLFRDGQLVGTSTPRERREKYIAEAPANVAAAKATDKVMDSPDDRAWRAANNLFDIKAKNVKKISPTRVEITVPGIELPRDGRGELEFSAYAFNTDRVKSETSRKSFQIEKPEKRKGKAYLISIGVNASENPQWNLQYAANDAREMQKVVGPKLTNDKDRYSDVVQIALISERGLNQKNDDPHPKENTAQKQIIKGVFSLLAGNGHEVSAKVREQIPNHKRIEKVQPEDTVIITFAGHGYADQAGIFYLMPFDVGKNTSTLSPDVLKRLISSDELSLWMQDITATEMIMIIDACHSAAAVQGDGFKPGPMGSRGLGQLAYDKGMKLLAATQSDNVALELDKLKQGLLTFVLLNDGIKEKKADTNGKGSLTATEWLTYATKAVPKLYDDVRAGRRSVILNGRNTEDWKMKEFQSGDLFFDTGEFERRLGSIQQPTVFDFRRRELNRRLLPLN